MDSVSHQPYGHQCQQAWSVGLLFEGLQYFLRRSHFIGIKLIRSLDYHPSRPKCHRRQQQSLALVDESDKSFAAAVTPPSSAILRNKRSHRISIMKNIQIMIS